jgi:hypothetical protein
MTLENMPQQQARAADGTDPRGWLVWDGPLPDDLQRGEDATQHHDFRGDFKWSSEFDDTAQAWVTYFEREATDTEKTLLAALNYTVPDTLTTRVSFPSPLVRRRRWPALETTTTEGSSTP